MGVERGAFSAVDDPAAAAAEFSGPEAAELAGVSYRQLDHWARQGWVVPSPAPGARVQRRVYTSADVLRLAALGHLGRSRVNVGTCGRATGRLRIPDTRDFVIVWAVHDKDVRVTSAGRLREVAGDPGRYVVFDPAAVLRALDRRREGAGRTLRRRRTFSVEYKLAVVAEYERLTAPGAKGALLRRERLHTSHLLAWRRGRSSGSLSLSSPSLRPVPATGHEVPGAQLSPPPRGRPPVRWAEDDDVPSERAS